MLVQSLAHPDVKSGWGLDYCWAKLLDYSGIAVIDAVRVVHTKPPAGLDSVATQSFYKRFKIKPVQEMNGSLARHGLRVRPPHAVLRRVPAQ